VTARPGGGTPHRGPAPLGPGPRVRLVLALHFHQPVGNFDTVFEDAVRLAYKPIVEHFERHPGVRAAFHVSGCLLEWLERHDRGILDRIVALVGAGQVEPLGGGFYEPILPVIPRADALDQLARLSSWWRRRAGVRPRGAWIAERVWEPALAVLLADAGIDYTILDDQHLRFAGLLDPRFHGVFVTERAARPVIFFPSDFTLRYMIPFKPVETLREHLASAASTLGDDGGPGPILTYGDDAEKFGLWPDTHAWVYGEGWLEKFFALLEDPTGPAEALAPRDALATRPQARKVHVPNASYTEMLEWALPAASVPPYASVRAAAVEREGAEVARAFVRGSLWDMFLARYPESDHLHKHVLWTSRRARALPAGTRARATAIGAALRAECNCPYWHGLFGGIYYAHLRHALYQAVLEADAVLAARDKKEVAVVAADIDGDLEEEVIVRTGRLQAFFRPADAGVLAELDDLATRFNVTNVVSRWRESYHAGHDVTHAAAGDGGVASPHEREVGVAESDLAGRTFDTRPLRGLRDFSAAGAFDSEGLARFDGMNFAEGRARSWRAGPRGFTLRVAQPGLTATRTITAEDGGTLRVEWDVETVDGGWFGTLLCLSLLTPRDEARSRLVVDDSGGEHRGAPGDPIVVEAARRLVLEDRVFGFALEAEFAPGARLVAAPIETLQRAEVRYESAYQGTMFALCWPASVARRAGAGPGLRLRFTDAGSAGA
jgi:4-alpha-glucanotransferase